jgi:uncharacterized protein (TIGR04255 family)
MAQRSRPADLPNFNKPPVTEVALSVQFDTIAGFSNVHAGLLWAEFRSEYPVASEKPAMAPQFETFGGGGVAPQVPFRFATYFAPPASRFWFEESSGAHLMQIQNDRIVHNWRKRDANEYPRYEPIADRFEEEIRKFEEFLRREGLGELRSNQYEVTYINTIELPDGSNPHHQLQRITPLCSVQPKMPNQLDPENMSVQARYILKKDSQPFGRVYINFAPVIRSSDLAPAVQLDITARARPTAQSAEAVLNLLDDEREIVVRTFAAVTSSEMHRLWERTDV